MINPSKSNIYKTRPECNKIKKIEKFVVSVNRPTTINAKYSKIKLLEEANISYLKNKLQHKMVDLIIPKNLNTDDDILTNGSEINKGRGNKNNQKMKFIKATKLQKIFTIYGGYKSIRQALLKRGWVEKSPYYVMNNNLDNNDLNFQYMTKSHPNFIWQPKKWRSLDIKNYFPFVNRVSRSTFLDFTTKIGLFGCVENCQWAVIDGLSELNTPRQHIIDYSEGKANFIRDYQLTYCIGLLKYINENGERIFDEYGEVNVDIVKGAVEVIRDDLNLNHKKSDTDIISPLPNIYTLHWNNFYKLVEDIYSGKSKLKSSSALLTRLCLIECQKILRAVQKLRPKMCCEGFENLWILKPGYLSQGYGIVIKRTLGEILHFLNNQTRKYIVQKYIEHPLLIYKTKFDIRQYMMVQITDHDFNIWMYKNCYLRFSTQEFKLNELTQAVHITNNTVQKRYQNGLRSNKLPPHNMWNLEQFKEYLIDIGERNKWSDTIYPGMKKNLIGVVLASLPETKMEKNHFELYGCDFIIMDNYEPILIEINSTPDMSASTIVTKNLCPVVLEDVIKVIIDLPKNPSASTGHFELIYSINYITRTNQYNDLTVLGKSASIITHKKPIKIENKIKNIDKNLIKQSSKVNITNDNILDSIDTFVQARQEISRKYPVDFTNTKNKKIQTDLLKLNMINILTEKNIKKEIMNIGKKFKIKNRNELNVYVDNICKKIMNVCKQ